MASVHRRPASKFWHAFFRDSEGRLIDKSTRLKDRKQAQRVADTLEMAAQRKKSAQHVRAAFAQISGQKNVVYHVLHSCDLLTGIEGKPGVGKTSTISEAAAAIRNLTGQDPVMLAPTARTVAKVREAGFDADTVANLRDKPALQAAAAGRIILVRRGERPGQPGL